MNKIQILFFTILTICTGCKPESWQYSRVIPLENITPIGIIRDTDNLWVSDVSNNRLVELSLTGEIIGLYDGFRRPMNIALSRSDNALYVPEYFADTVRIFKNGKISTLQLVNLPDSPAGVAVYKDYIAIADFFGHRIILKNNKDEIIIGQEGHEFGDLYYPTDVAFYNDELFVADAYNNRVMVYDLKGNKLKAIGYEDGINVATGIEVADDRVFVTDFHGNRVLIYDLLGNLQQILTESIKEPTDLSYSKKDNLLYIANYGDNSILVYEKK